MGIFSFMKNQHIESIEWTDPEPQTLVYSFPAKDQLIKMGAELTVRESQTAVFVCDGKVADVFGPGRYVLSTEKLPVLTVLYSWKYGFNSPFKAAVFFVNTKQFHDVRWATANPVPMEDAEFGSVRLRAAGLYSYKVSDAELFMKEILGSNQIYETAYLTGQQKSILGSGLTEMLAEAEIPVDELVSRKNELGVLIENRLRNRFIRMGLELSTYTIEEIVLPDELIAAIEERNRLAEEARLKAIEEEEARLRAEEEARLREEEEARLRALEEEELAAQEAAAVLAAQEAEAMESELTCVSCNSPLKPSMKFCPECGAKVE